MAPYGIGLPQSVTFYTGNKYKQKGANNIYQQSYCAHFSENLNHATTSASTTFSASSFEAFLAEERRCFLDFE